MEAEGFVYMWGKELNFLVVGEYIANQSNYIIRCFSSSSSLSTTTFTTILNNLTAKSL